LIFWYYFKSFEIIVVFFNFLIILAEFGVLFHDYLDLVSYLMEPTGTGQVNVTCPVGSTLADQQNLSTEISPQFCTCLMRLATSQKPLTKEGKTVMLYPVSGSAMAALLIRSSR
jgi:hypothetical protein